MNARNSESIRREIDSLSTPFDLDRFMRAVFDDETYLRRERAWDYIWSLDEARAAQNPKAAKLAPVVDEYLDVWREEWHAWELQERHRVETEKMAKDAERDRLEAERKAQWEARQAAEEARRAELMLEQERAKAEHLEELRALAVEAEANLKAVVEPVMVELEPMDGVLHGRSTVEDDWIPLPRSILALKLRPIRPEQYAAFFGISLLEASVAMGDDEYAILDPGRHLRPMDRGSVPSPEAPGRPRKATVAGSLANLLSDGNPRTVAALADAIGQSEQAVALALKRGAFESDQGRPARWSLAPNEQT